MNAIINLGKYIYAIPFAIFGLMHFANASSMAAMAPFGGVAIVYFTGAALVAAAVSILIGKMDKLAAFLLGIMLISFVLGIHIPGVMSGDEAQMMTSMPNMLKDLSLAGAAWMYAGIAKDDAVIG